MRDICTTVTALRQARTLVCVALCACGGADRSAPVDPSSVTRINLRVERVRLTQATQDEDGTLPVVAGSAAVLNVVVTRSAESVVEVPLVLRLFRRGAMVFTDTARTGGVLGPTYPAVGFSAQFLIPAALVASDVSWQVELDPLRTHADSTRADNVLPGAVPAALPTVTVPPLRLRLVPITLGRHGGLTGNVSAGNAELYLRLTRQIFPVGALSVTVGEPLSSSANFGTLPGPGGSLGFWDQVVHELDDARIASGVTDEYWYGVVPMPGGYDSVQWGGVGYTPREPQGVGPGTRTSAGLGASEVPGIGVSVDFAQQTLAHELGHNFGRLHAPGCGAVAPIDSGYRGIAGSITVSGHDVWSWASGLTRGAQLVGGETGDVMSYCSPKWVGPYTYAAVLAWRQVLPVLGQVSARRGAYLALP
jgi:hypothetical protein